VSLLPHPCFTWNNYGLDVTRTIAIANQKGGVGKTTTALNLAAALAHSGKSVVLLDLDPQANATSGIGVDVTDDHASHPLLAPESAQLSRKPTSVAGLSVVPSSPGLVALEHELSRHAEGPTRLRQYLTRRTVDGDFCIIDCPPSLGLLTTNALNAASGVLIPIQCEYFAMEGLTRVLRRLEDIRRSTNHGIRLEGIALTMFDPDLPLCGEVVSEVRDYFPDDVYETIIPRDVALSEAASFGQSVFEYAPRGPGSLAYLELAKEVIANG